MKIRLVFGLCVALLVSGCSSGDVSSSDARSSTPSSRASEPSAETSETRPALDCLTPARKTVRGAPVVPRGVVAARLCGGQIHNGGLNHVWPADVLTGTRAAALVDQLNRLRPYRQPSGCTLPLETPFDLVLQYPTGRRVLIHGDTSGTCAHLSVQGGREWRGSRVIRGLALSLIRDQRNEQMVANPSVFHAVQPGCPEEWQDLSQTLDLGNGAAVDGRVLMTACEYRLQLDQRFISQSAKGQLVSQVEVDDPTAMMREVRRGSRIDPCDGREYTLDAIQRVLIISDSLGDMHVVPTEPCWGYSLGGHRIYGPSAGTMYPTDALIDKVIELL